MTEALVAGIESSTQSTKVLLVRASDGTVVVSAAVPHPTGTQVHPNVWWNALQQGGAGLLDRASAIGVGGQDPGAIAAHTPSGIPLSTGTGDNTAAAMGLVIGPGDVVVSIGGVVHPVRGDFP